MTTKKKVINKKNPDLYKHYRMLSDALMEECNEMHERIHFVRVYLDEKSILGFVRASSIRRFLLPKCDRSVVWESNVHRFFREWKEYLKEVMW